MLLFFLSLSRILSGRRVFGNVLIMIVNNRSRRFPRLDSPRSVESYFWVFSSLEFLWMYNKCDGVESVARLIKKRKEKENRDTIKNIANGWNGSISRHVCIRDINANPVSVQKMFIKIIITSYKFHFV